MRIKSTMINRIAWLIILCFSVFNSVAMANDRDQQRSLFKELYQQALIGQKSAVAAHQKDLADYPIYHYLEYALLVAEMDDLPIAKINAFKKDHPDSPLNRRLAGHLQTDLAEQ